MQGDFRSYTPLNSLADSHLASFTRSSVVLGSLVFCASYVSASARVISLRSLLTLADQSQIGSQGGWHIYSYLSLKYNLEFSRLHLGSLCEFSGHTLPNHSLFGAQYHRSQHIT
jgi:hypothetical protein